MMFKARVPKNDETRKIIKYTEDSHVFNRLRRYLPILPKSTHSLL